MNENTAWATDFIRSLGLEGLSHRTLRRVTNDDGAGLILDWNLTLAPLPRHKVASFIAHQHAHCGVPVTWRLHHGVFNGTTLVGIAVVGNTVAPALGDRGMVEVNRLCVRRDTPAALRWNATSILYGWFAREADRL